MIVSLSKTFLILIGTTAFSKAQLGRPCNDPSVCQNGATECFDRLLDPNAGETEVNYVCNCTQTQTIGFACELEGPSHRQDRAEESFQTCYGNDCRTGFFESINYPSLYIGNWRAIYLLFIPGATRISFNFEGEGGFGIESFRDELYIGTGLIFSTEDFQSTNIITENREVRFFDNTTLNGRVFPPPFYFDSDAAWFYFYTDKSIHWHGWRIAWRAIVDTMPPVIIRCPSDIQGTVERGQSQFVTISWTEPLAYDVSPPITMFSTHEPGDIFFVGSTTVTYTVNDRYGNQAQCSFLVIILEVDTTPPEVANCPPIVFETIELGETGASVTWMEPTALDISEVTQTSTKNPGDFFFIGETTLVIILEDSSSNPAICIFIVTVQTQDTTPPVISSCPSDQTQMIELGAAQPVISWVQPTATDLSGNSTVIHESHQNGTTFPMGTTQVTYIFSDPSGNIATCSFNVEVTIGNVMMCPSSRSFFTCNHSITVSWTTPVADNISQSNLTITSSHLPGDTFTIGKSEIVYNFTDQFGRTIQCIFRVSIERDLENCSPVFNTVYIIVAISIFFAALFFIFSVVICIKKCKQNEGVTNSDEGNSSTRNGDTKGDVDLDRTSHSYHNINEYERSIATSDSHYASYSQYEEVTQN